MKITYLAEKFPKLSETFILSQITGLIDKGHDVEIISITRPVEDQSHKDVSRYNLLDKTHYLNRNNSRLGFELSRDLLKCLLSTDLIHAHFATNPAAWALKLSTLFDIPYAITTHAYDLYVDPQVSELQEKFKESSALITTTDYNREYMYGLLENGEAEDISLIRYGIDLDRYKVKTRKPRKKVQILFVGRLVEKKAPVFAVECFEKLLDKHKNVEFRIVGDGPLKNDVINKIEELNLSKKVQLLGPQPSAEVLKELNRADIFFLPSRIAENGDREGSPVSILEAEAVGLPIVSTYHTGIPEIVIDGKTGLLAEEKDTDAITAQLSKLVENPDMRSKMGKAARLHVEKNYSRTRELDELEKVLVSAVKERPLRSEQAKDNIEHLDLCIENFLNIFNEINKDLEQKNQEIKQINHLVNELQSNLNNIKDKSAYKFYTRAHTILTAIKNKINDIY